MTAAGRSMSAPLGDLGARTRPARVEVDGVAIAVVLDSQRRGARHRRHLHPRRHLAVRGLRRRTSTLECWAHGSAFSPAHRQAPQPPRVRAGPGVPGRTIDGDDVDLVDPTVTLEAN